MKEIEDELENQELDGEFFGMLLWTPSFAVAYSSVSKVFVTRAERKSLARQKLVKQWEISTTLAASCAVRVGVRCVGKHSTTCTGAFTAKKITW